MRFAWLIICLIAPGAVRAQLASDVLSISLSGSEVADSRSNIEANPAFRTDTSFSLWTRATPSANYIDGALELTAAAVIPFDAYRIGVHLEHLGYEEIYGFSEAGISLSRHFGGNRAEAGVRIRYASESFGDRIPSSSLFAFDLGARFEPIEHLTLGADLRDIDRGTGAITEAGLGYALDDATLLASARLVNDRSSLNFGIELPVVRAILLRVGTESASHTISGGVDVEVRSLHVELSFVEHPDLGSSVSVGLRWDD